MSYWSGGYQGWAPRKTSGERRADAARMVKDAARRGKAMSPVAITGRKIAQTFWGKAWCDNLERYRDFAYRLERGRSYLRSGSVVDLQISAGKIAAQVSGSSLYDIAIEIDAVERNAWRAIQRDCAGGIGSRIDLLSGKLSEPVMARLCADRTGLFPAPSAIRFTCSCPDYATMCKHVAAAMYGVGARLDHAPEHLFTLRRVSLDELLASAVTELPATPSAGRVLAASGLAALFGIELAEAPADKPAAPRRSRASQPAASPAAPAAPAAAKARPARRVSSKAPARSSASSAPGAPQAILDAKARPSLLPARTRKSASPAARTAAATRRAVPTAKQSGAPAARTAAAARRDIPPATPRPGKARRRSKP
jgi:uncharacterized Zn finger protein